MNGKRAFLVTLALATFGLGLASRSSAQPPVPSPSPPPTLPTPAPPPPPPPIPVPTVKPCVATTFYTTMVKDACAKGGQKEANDAMVAWQKLVKSRSPGLDCPSCHTHLDPTYDLTADAVVQYKKLGGK